MGDFLEIKQVIANLWRPMLAHIVAVTFTGFAVTAGVILIEHGASGIAMAMQIGPMFLAALLAFAAITLPGGLLLRALCGKIAMSPLVCLAAMGCLFGLALIPFLHPELTDGRVTLETSLAGLLFVHVISGLLGGALWWVVEFRLLGKGAG